MAKNISLADVQSWSGNSEYLPNDVVIFQDKYYFCLKKVKGMNPIEGADIFWVTALKFIWEPSYLSRALPRIVPRISNFVPGVGAMNIEKAKANNHLLILDLKFSIRSDLETKAILTFLEMKRGFESFDFLAPEPYNKLIKVRCRKFRHSYVFYDNNEISATFEEVA